MSTYTNVSSALAFVFAGGAAAPDGLVFDRALAEPKGAYGVFVIGRDSSFLGLQCEHRLSLDANHSLS